MPYNIHKSLKCPWQGGGIRRALRSFQLKPVCGSIMKKLYFCKYSKYLKKNTRKKKSDHVNTIQIHCNFTTKPPCCRADCGEEHKSGREKKGICNEELPVGNGEEQ